MAETTKQDVKFLEQFEPDVFWQQHGQKIIWGFVVVVAIGLIAAYQQRQATEREEAAAVRLSQAHDPATLQAIAKDFPEKPVGAQALLRLAELHFEAGHYPAATAVYQELLTRFPSSPLAEPARLSLVAIVEAQGNFEVAKGQYLQLASRPGSFIAVAAKIGAARCAEALGQTKDAQQLYEELLPAVAGTVWEGPVYIRRAIVSRVAGPLPPAQPAAAGLDFNK